MSRAQPLQPKKPDTHKPGFPYKPLPKRPPRKLDYEGCENCRKAKKKCIMDNLDQPSRCSRCCTKGLLCPGPKRARSSIPVNTGISSSATASSLTNFAIDMSSIATFAPSLSIEQLKAQPCLTCNALGLSCESEHPGETPCSHCLNANSYYILQSRICMRAAPFEDVSIFLSCILSLRASHKTGCDSTNEDQGLPNCQILENLWTKAHHLKINKTVFMMNGIWADFDKTLPSSEIDMVTTLLRAKFSFPTSKMGILSTPIMIRLIQEHFPQQIALLFRLMLCGTTYSYDPRDGDGKPIISCSDIILYHLGTFAGHKILKFLDSELNLERLSTASFEKRRVLFSLVYGTTIAIRHTDRPCPSPELTSANPMSKELWYRLREHLYGMLGHHLVILGTSIGLWFSKDEENWSLRWRPEHTLGQRVVIFRAISHIPSSGSASEEVDGVDVIEDGVDAMHLGFGALGKKGR